MLTQLCARAVHVKADDSPGARVVVMSKPPFHIESVSSGWVQMHGMSEVALRGRSLRVLEGPGTDMRAVSRLMDAVVRGVESQASFMTYTASGKRLWTHVVVAPLLSESGTIDSFVAETLSYDLIELPEALLQEQAFQLLIPLEDPNYCIGNASQALCQLLSVPRERLIGMPLNTVLASRASSRRFARIVAEVVRGVDVKLQRGSHYIALQSQSQGQVVREGGGCGLGLGRVCVRERERAREREREIE